MRPWIRLVESISLDGHEAIAWDFDGTLIDHPKSALMHRYILDHPDKRHIIVTFRSHGMEQRIWDDLAAYRGAPTQTDFDGVLSIPPATWERFAREQQLRQRRNDWASPPLPHELDYIEWKGRVCRQHGLTVLVDDKVEHVMAGCTKYGICFVNPDDF